MTRRWWIQAHANKVAARSGYAKNGKGRDSGVSGRPMKIANSGKIIAELFA